MYSTADYWKMLADHVRREAYAEALRRAVKPGSVVANIGAGSGIFALLACQAGARRVYAIEPDDIIEVAKSLAAANGFRDRIEFIQGLSTHVDLPEPADVIVSDLRGVLPLMGHHLPSIADARRRMLAPGGVLIPQRDELWAAIVEAPDLYSRLVAPWGLDPHSLDFGPARKLAVNRWSKVRVSPGQLLVEPRLWTKLDYERVDDPNVQADLNWVVSRPGTAHGVCVWFNSTLVDGVNLSSAPDQPELIYGAGFFPWESPVPLTPGDAVAVELSANLVGDEYVWRWSSRVEEHGKGGARKADFHQSNFLATPLSPARLRHEGVEHVPELSQSGEIDRAILGLMTGAESVSDIADRISQQFPARFPASSDALPRVQQLSQRYSKAD